MSRRKITINIFIIIILLLWISKSNSIFLLLTNKDAAFKCSDIECVNNDLFTYGISNISAFNDWSESISIEGWIFGDCAQDKDYRLVYVYLKSDRDTYKMLFKTPEEKSLYKYSILREDIVQAYPEYNLQNREIGFVGEISLLNVKNGEYDIYIECHENEDDYGIVKYDKGILIKSNDGIKLKSK